MDFTDYQSTINSNGIVAFIPEASAIYNSILSGSMPPNKKLSQEQISIVRQWISQGAQKDQGQCTPQPSKTQLTRLSNEEYLNIMKDLDVESEDSLSFPQLPPHNGFTNRIPTPIKKEDFESYMELAEHFAPRIASAAPINSICGVLASGLSYNWENCGENVIRHVGLRLFRRPLRPEEESKLEQIFLSNFSASQEPIQTSNNYRGNLDGFGTRDGNYYANGWVADLDMTNRQVLIDFFVSNSNQNTPQIFIGRISTGVPRPDVNQVVQISGDHGFEFPIPKDYLNNNAYKLYAIVKEDRDYPLVGSPRDFQVLLENSTTELANQSGGNFQEALSSSISALLISPDFIFKPEFTAGGFDEDEESYKKVSKLAFLTRSSFADDQLLVLAQDQNLGASALEDEAQRMINQYSERFSVNFAGSWLSYKEDLSNSSDALLKDYALESHYLFKEVLKDNASSQSLLDPGFTFINENISTLYGINTNSAMHTKVNTDERGGILSQGHFLTTTSSSMETSAVKRGIWVLNNVLCRPLPDLSSATFEEIANATEVIDQSLPLDVKMELHRDFSTQCYTCHSQIDPPGLVLDEFDQQGRKKSNWSITPIKYGTKEIQSSKEFVSSLKQTGEFDLCFDNKLKAYISGSPELLIPGQCQSSQSKLGKDAGIADKIINHLVNEVSQ